jgi:hypothetical protein
VRLGERLSGIQISEERTADCLKAGGGTTLDGVFGGVEPGFVVDVDDQEAGDAGLGECDLIVTD